MQDRSPFVNFVQGNVFYLPFKKESFDYVHSSGVLYHTPSKERAFKALIPLLKKDGEMFIWVYKTAFFQSLFLKTVRALTTKLPQRLLLLLCFIIAPLWDLGRRISGFIGCKQYVELTLREIAISLFDLLLLNTNFAIPEMKLYDGLKRWDLKMLMK